MTIDEAIEILTLRTKEFRPGYDSEERNATQLGIEALDYIRRERLDNPGVAYTVFKGETRE